MDYEPYEIDGDNRIVPIYSRGWAKNQPTETTTFDDALAFFLKAGLDDAGLVGPNRQELVESIIQYLPSFKARKYLNAEEALYLLTGVMLERASYRFEWEGQIFFPMRPDFGLRCILQNFNAAPVNDYESKLRDELLRFSEEVEAIYLAIKYGEILAPDVLGNINLRAPMEEWVALFQDRGFDLSHIPAEFMTGNHTKPVSNSDAMGEQLQEAKNEIALLEDKVTEQQTIIEKVKQDKAASEKLNPKSKGSLLKMILAMAIKGYGFNPEDKKSPIPGEIAVDTEALGLPVGDDTTRRWLREAAQLLISVKE